MLVSWSQYMSAIEHAYILTYSPVNFMRDEYVTRYVI